MITHGNISVSPSYEPLAGTFLHADGKQPPRISSNVILIKGVIYRGQSLSALVQALIRMISDNPNETRVPYHYLCSDSDQGDIGRSLSGSLYFYL